MDNARIRWLVEQEIEARQEYRLTRMLKSMDDEELAIYKKKIFNAGEGEK